MNRESVVALARLVAEVAGTPEPLIVGSQALYASLTDVPDGVEHSKECDFLFPLGDEGRERVRDQLGFGSSFHEVRGYYADPLVLPTVILPAGWESRLRPIGDATGIAGRCTDLYDTCVSKLMAGRRQDHDLVGALVTNGSLDLDVLLARASLLGTHPNGGILPERLESFGRSRGVALAQGVPESITTFASALRSEVFARAGVGPLREGLAESLDSYLAMRRRAADPLAREVIDVLRARARAWIAAAPEAVVRPLFEELTEAIGHDRDRVLIDLLDTASVDPTVGAAVRAYRQACVRR